MAMEKQPMETTLNPYARDNVDSATPGVQDMEHVVHMQGGSGGEDPPCPPHFLVHYETIKNTPPKVTIEEAGMDDVP